MLEKVSGIIQIFGNYTSIPLNVANNASQTIAHLAVYYKAPK
jgi:hypothetical protein